MEQQAIRHAIEHDRWEASALFTQALTGLEPPPRPGDTCRLPSSGSVDLGRGGAREGREEGGEAFDCLGGTQRALVASDEANDVRRRVLGRAGVGGMYWGREEEEEEEVLLPPRWQVWKRDDEPDDMPKFWHREPLVHSRGGYVDNVSPVYLAGILANRAQLYRQACSAASMKLKQYIDADGRPEACDQPSPEMADLMSKALEDLDEAELQVWRGYDVEPREWLLRHALNILESVGTAFQQVPPPTFDFHVSMCMQSVRRSSP